MSDNAKGISTSKGFHGKVPYAKHAVKLSEMEVVTGNGYNGLGQCGISETGIYVICAKVTNNGTTSYKTGIICIPSLTNVAKGTAYGGTLEYSVSNGLVTFTSSTSGETVSGVTAYKIADV